MRTANIPLAPTVCQVKALFDTRSLNPLCLEDLTVGEEKASQQKIRRAKCSVRGNALEDRRGSSDSKEVL